MNSVKDMSSEENDSSVESGRDPGGSGLYLARKSQVIVVIWGERIIMEWYAVDKCGI